MEVDVKYRIQRGNITTTVNVCAFSAEEINRIQECIKKSRKKRKTHPLVIMDILRRKKQRQGRIKRLRELIQQKNQIQKINSNKKL